MFTDESINPFSTFPCSADKGTVVPPVMRSSTISVILTLVAMSVVFTANKAKGTAVNGALLISVKVEQPSVLKSIFKFLGNKLH